MKITGFETENNTNGTNGTATTNADIGRMQTRSSKYRAPSNLPTVLEEEQVQCEGQTQRGERCQRTPKEGETRCHYHKATCQGRNKRGNSCKNAALHGHSFCGYHAATCTGTTKSGEPCQLAKEFCHFHNQQETSSPGDPMKWVNEETAPRCQGITKVGNQCRRRPQTGQEFCHFHNPA